MSQTKKQLATEMKNFFINITKDLEREREEDNSSNAATMYDVRKTFNAQASVERIRRNVKINENIFQQILSKIYFQQVTEDLV